MWYRARRSGVRPCAEADGTPIVGMLPEEVENSATQVRCAWPCNTSSAPCRAKTVRRDALSVSRLRHATVSGNGG